ncbi:hypothetical protein V500_04387 [Pseudogymnoascus sp. VKM F-4518 (FW-2643)]|nr:hypothetical protein V500_04387 [Pseudogymnoascus sp. VKM F-4518 (FW-2643)]
MKYGLRVQAQGNIVGPWNCTPIDKRLTLEGWEGFTVVEEEENVWALYFDRDADGLERKVKPNKRIMEIELIRKEMRISKDELDMAEQEEELQKGDDEGDNKKDRRENETDGEKEAQKTTRRSRERQRGEIKRMGKKGR